MHYLDLIAIIKTFKPEFNVSKYEGMLFTLHRNYVASQLRGINWLMFLRKIMSAYSKDRTKLKKHILEFFCFKINGANINHVVRASKTL
jgi:hypothetical protein